MIVIGVDLDGTLAAYQGWTTPEDVGEPDVKLVQLLAELKSAGCVLCTWTCRANHVVEAWLEKHELRYLFDHINESPYPTETAKASFDLLIDDVGFHWHPKAEPSAVMNRLSKLSAGIMDADISRDVDFSDRNPKVFYQGTGRMFVDHFENKWKGLWSDHKFEKPTAFLTICSHAKPYSKSWIHASLRGHLYGMNALDRVDYIHLSGAGIIPASGEMVYPFNAYDGNMAEATDNARAHLRTVLTRRLGEWFDMYGDRYENFVVYLRNKGNTIKAVREAIDPRNDPRIFVVEADQGDQYRCPFALDDDPDDVLLHAHNLFALDSALIKAGVI